MRYFVSVLLVFLILVLSVVPVFSADLQGGYYFDCNCSLGNNIRFYVPSAYIDDLTFTSADDLFNLSSSTVYLYCPDFSSYTVRANRFDRFQYTTGSYPQTYNDLHVTAILDSNISFLVDTPHSVSDSTILIMIFCAVVLFGFIGVFLYRRH